MKKFILFIVAILITQTASFGNDLLCPPKIDERLQGTWYLRSFSTDRGDTIEYETNTKDKTWFKILSYRIISNTGKIFIVEKLDTIIDEQDWVEIEVKFVSEPKYIWRIGISKDIGIVYIYTAKKRKECLRQSFDVNH